MKNLTLKSISKRKILDMGQCMCPVNCRRKAVDNKQLTKTVIDTYSTPTLKEISSREVVDMGQCMCPVNCTKKAVDNQQLTNEVLKTYQKVFKKVA